MFKSMNARAGLLNAYVDFIFADKKNSQLVLGSFFQRDTTIKGFSASALSSGLYILEQGLRINNVETTNYTTVLNSGAEIVSQAVMHDETGKYLFTCKGKESTTFYDYLMNNFDLPLMHEWSAKLLQRAENTDVVTRPCTLLRAEGGTETLPLYGQNIPLEEIIVLRVDVTQEWLDETVGAMLSAKEICICEDEQQPLTSLREKDANVDKYFEEYGATVRDNLCNLLTPQNDFTPVVKHLALKGKKPFPEQANAIAGAANFLRKNPYVIFNMGMGCGKTLSSIATVESYHVTKWLNSHPNKSLKDCYINKDNINYRIIVTCPGHLLEKWKEEILEIIPYAKVYILRKFKDVTKIKKRGYKRNGKEFYIISKDFMKLESSYRPTPWKVAEASVPKWECEECGHTLSTKEICKIPVKRQVCTCGHKHFVRKIDESEANVTGLLCPECSNILMKSIGEGADALQPEDFANKKTTNGICCHCGTKLWVPDVSNLEGLEGNSMIKKETRWKRVSHYTNKTKKNRTTSWVMRGYEEVFYAHNDINKLEVENTPDRKIRKVAPAAYMHKQLCSSWFDFAIHDELHNYKGGATAQGIAMHQITKCARKTIGLTGTIAGGYSEDLFYLFYRLDPARMRKNGFSYDKISEFSDIYGTREASFEMRDDEAMNKSSRGRQLSAKKTKPGISPLIFGDLLIDRCLFLDITDMGSHMPELKEEIVLCDTDKTSAEEYNRVLRILKDRCKGPGLSPLSSTQLQFSMSYLDKPYEHDTIIHPKTGEIVVKPISFFPEKGELLPKEKELVELVNKELQEGRNVFIYCEYTSSPQTKVTERVKNVLETHCNLKDAVAILESSKPKASEREAWLKKQAIAGKKVIISNPKCVETGLDFIFKDNGITYTYPTLVFYQMGYNLFTLWQASRRHYRLNQTKECRTYYLAYRGTVQQTILSTMAEKQVATSAIQGGKFSAEGLSAMANGVDSKLRLLQMLNGEGSVDDGSDIAAKFNNLSNKKQAAVEYDTSKAVDFYELVGMTETTEANADTNTATAANLFEELFKFNTATNNSARQSEVIVDTTAREIEEDVDKTDEIQSHFTIDVDNIGKTQTKKKKKRGVHEQQLSIFSLFA